MIYRHPKHGHTQNVEEWEKVKISILRRSGWLPVDEPLPVVEPEPVPPPVDETPIREALSHQPAKRGRKRKA